MSAVPESAAGTELRDEQSLLQAVLARERKATAQFVDLCTDWIYGFVRRRLMPRSELVEDVMQEILFAAWQALPNFREEASLRSWVLGIARHKVDDYYRRRICETDLPEDEDESEEPRAQHPGLLRDRPDQGKPHWHHRGDDRKTPGRLAG